MNFSVTPLIIGVIDVSILLLCRSSFLVMSPLMRPLFLPSRSPRSNHRPIISLMTPLLSSSLRSSTLHLSPPSLPLLMVPLADPLLHLLIVLPTMRHLQLRPNLHHLLHHPLHPLNLWSHVQNVELQNLCLVSTSTQLLSLPCQSLTFMLSVTITGPLPCKTNLMLLLLTKLGPLSRGPKGPILCVLCAY